MITKVRVDEVKFGIILTRKYLGDSADEVGSIDQWNEVFSEIYAHIPYKSVWKGLRVNAINMDSELLDEESKRNASNLQDYDTKKEGYQVAAGLYFNRERLDIAFFPLFWTIEPVDYDREITDRKRQDALNNFAHEFGHHLARISGIVTGGSVIRNELNKHYMNVKTTFNDSIGEGIAEEIRAFFGDSETFGTLSNKVPLKIEDHPKLYTLLRVMYPIQAHLASKNIAKTLLWDKEFLWNEVGFKYTDIDGDGMPEVVDSVWYSMDRNWKRYVWYRENGKWMKRSI